MLTLDHSKFSITNYIAFSLSSAIIETKQIPGKISGISGIVHFSEINQTPSLYWMLQHRRATTKLVPRNCLIYLHTTLVLAEGY